jgi:hypothetical protein
MGRRDRQLRIHPDTRRTVVRLLAEIDLAT